MATLKQVCSGNRSASCVQRFDDSRSAIRITYRISLRSSSSREPRYPLLKVVSVVCEDGRSRAARPEYAEAYTVSWFYLGSFRVRKSVEPLTRPYHVRFAGIGTPHCCERASAVVWDGGWDRVVMILPQVHLRKPCYDFTFL